MMARQTGTEAQLNALINRAREVGAKMGKEFCGMEPNIAFFGEANHPDINRAFENAWLKASQGEIAKELENEQ